MHTLFLRTLLALACATAAHASAEETAAEKAAREEKVKARLAEHALRKATDDAPHVAPESAPAAPAPVAQAPAKADPITTLPELEVRNTRISELDVKIRKLNKDIARERKKMKSSDTDKALNSDKASRAMALFGGKSTSQRESVAAERVNLMESERDLLELMKLPATKEELKLLEQQVDSLRTVRRNLDEALR